MEERIIMKADNIPFYRGILSERLNRAVQSKDTEQAEELFKIINAVDAVLDTAFINFMVDKASQIDVNPKIFKHPIMLELVSKSEADAIRLGAQVEIEFSEAEDVTDGNTDASSNAEDVLIPEDEDTLADPYRIAIKNANQLECVLAPLMKKNFTSNMSEIISVYRDETGDISTRPDIIWRALVHCYGSRMHKSWHRNILNLTYAEPLEAFYGVKAHIKDWDNTDVVNLIRGIVAEEVYGETARLDISYKMHYSNDSVVDAVLNNENLRKKIAFVNGIPFKDDNPTTAKLIEIAKRDKNFFSEKFLSHLKTRKEYHEEGYPTR